MASDVKTKRRYDSSGRREAAERNRAAMIKAAHRLFIEQGFAATTMPAVAAEAGVSVQTVYKAFNNKPGLAKNVFDVAIAGDLEPMPVLQRAPLSRVQAESDGRRKIRLYGDFLAEVAPSHVPIQLVIRDAAAGDREAAAVWTELQAERLKGMTMFARHLRDGGHLRAGISANEARDVLWMYNSAEIYELLVVERGWSPKRYGRWVADAIAAALLR